MARSTLLQNGRRDKSSSWHWAAILYAKLFEDWWLVELLAVLGSCAFVIALFLVLKAYDGQPEPLFRTFFDSGITLGTLISLFSNLAVALALAAVDECISQLKWLWYAGSRRPLRDIETYDSASRGILGSIQLLWKLRLTPIASFGALLIISQLAITPLAQQSLSTLSLRTPEPTEATKIGVTSTWFENIQQTRSRNVAEAFSSLSSGMKGAILNGLFTDVKVTIDDIVPACSSGNCTFLDYKSLALCAATADVTSHLQGTTLGDTDQFCLSDDICVYIDRQTPVVANITSAISSSSLLDQTVSDQWHEPLDFTSIAFANHVIPVADFYIFYANTTGGKGNTWAAVEFVLDWCVPTFSTNVTNGTAVTTRGPNPFMDFTAPPRQDITSCSGGDCDPADLYSIDAGTHYSLQRYMALAFAGLANKDQDGPFADSDEVARLASLFVGSSQADEHITPDSALSALNKLLANIATSMTNYVRTQPGNNYVSGTVWTQQTIVSISWRWLVAPAVFTGVSLLFFLVVVALGSRGGRARPPLWKSSVVMAMRSLDPNLQPKLGGPPGRRGDPGSHEAAERQLVSLARDGDGWMLMQADAVVGTGRDVGDVMLADRRRQHEE